MTNGLLLLLALAGLGYSVWSSRPGLLTTIGSFLLSGIVALVFVWTRHSLGGTRSWAGEMLQGGDPAVASSNPLHAAAGAIIWLLLWAIYLQDDTSQSDRRGPWVLALLPLVLVLAITLMGPPDMHRNLASAAPLALLVVVGYAVMAALYWRLRRGDEPGDQLFG